MRIATSDRSPLTYTLGSEQLNVVSLRKILALWRTINLSFTSTLHLLLPRRIRFWVLVSPFEIDSLPRLYKALVCPVVEYADSIWGPFYIGDQRMIEKAQKRATRLIPSLRDLHD